MSRHLTADALTCAICDEKYRDLGVHVRLTHHLEPERYRHLAGLPAGQTLKCPSLYDETAAILVEARKRHYPDGQPRAVVAPSNGRPWTRDYYLENLLAALDLVAEQINAMQHFLRQL